MKFGDRLKTSRLEKGLTQEQVAKNFYVTRQTISGWENEISYPDITNLIRISDYYQVSLDTLLKEDTGMQEYLQKQKVMQSIKPIIWLLLIIDLLSLGLMIFNIVGVINIVGMSLYILITIMVLNAVALIQLSMLQYKLDNNKNHNIKPFQHMLIVVATAITFIGLILWLTKFYLASGFITGIGIATLISSAVYRYFNHIFSEK